MRPHYVSHAPFTEWVLAASVYRKGDRDFWITGSPLCRGWPLKGLSPVMGDYHAGFLGGLGSEMTLGYPVCDTKSRILTVRRRYYASV